MARAKAQYFVLAVDAETKGRNSYYPDARVGRALKRSAKRSGVACKVIVPRHREFIRGPDGKPRERLERSFPGYVVVRGVYCGNFFHLCSQVRGAAGLLPLNEDDDPDWRPSALEDKETALLLIRQKCGGRGGDKPDYKAGDTVTVKGGSFQGQTGVVAALVGKGADLRAKVALTIMGQQTTVTLPWWLVNKE